MEGEGDVVDRLLADWTRWAAQQRATQSVRDRQRERWLRQQQSEAATLIGVLVDLAEQRSAVTVAVGRRRLAGRLVGVGADLCVLEEAGGSSLVRLGALEGIWPGKPETGRAGEARPAVAGGVAGGDRTPVSGLRFPEALSALAAELAPVRILLTGGEYVNGDLVGVGLDVVTVSMSASCANVYLPAAAIAVCTPV